MQNWTSTAPQQNHMLIFMLYWCSNSLKTENKAWEQMIYSTWTHCSVSPHLWIKILFFYFTDVIFNFLTECWGELNLNQQFNADLKYTGGFSDLMSCIKGFGRNNPSVSDRLFLGALLCTFSLTTVHLPVIDFKTLCFHGLPCILSVRRFDPSWHNLNLKCFVVKNTGNILSTPCRCRRLI